jgi:hypothetical protein
MTNEEARTFERFFELAGAFERFFELARAHGLGLSDCMRIARVETGKALADLTVEELHAFAERICGVDRERR